MQKPNFGESSQGVEVCQAGSGKGLRTLGEPWWAELPLFSGNFVEPLSAVDENIFAHLIWHPAVLASLSQVVDRYIG